MSADGLDPGGELRRRVTELESEVRALRARLDDLAPGDPRPTTTTRQTRPSEPETRAPALAPPPARPTGAVPPPPRPTRPAPSTSTPVRHTPLTPPVPDAPPLPHRKPARRVDLERAIGGRVFAAAGALAVVIGLALLVKLAIDAGWWGAIPPALRCMSIAALGFAMLGAAEVLRKRINAFAAVGLNAAGLGAIYVAAYGAYSYFGLIHSSSVAFILLAATTALGIAIALRSRLLAVGVLALIGGYLAPILLASSDSPVIALPLYLLALCAVGLALSYWRRRPFAPMRELAWVGTALLGLLWTFSRGSGAPEIGIVFVFGVWALFHAELLGSAKRSGLIGDRPEPSDRKGAEVDGEDVNEDAPTPPLSAHAPISRRTYKLIHPLALSIATSAWTAWLAWYLMGQAAWSSWLAPAAIGAAALVAGSILAGHLRVLRDAPRTDAERLGLTLYAQAGAFLIVAVVFAFAGWAEIVSLLAVGVGAAVAARFARARALHHYAFATLCVAVVRLLIDAYQWGGVWLLKEPILGIALSRWMVLAWATGASWIAVGWLGSPSKRTARGTACLAVATALAGLSIIAGRTDLFALTLAWLIGSAALIVGGTRVRWAHASVIGLCALGGTLVAWSAAWADSSLQTRATFAVFMAPGPWVGGTVALVGLGAIATARRVEPGSIIASRGVWIGAIVGTCAALLVVTSAEISRSAAIIFDDQTAERATLSLWWAIVGAGAIAVGFWRRVRIARHVGLGLIGLAALKVVAIDLATVAPAWRVIAMLALGVIMLAVAVPYAIWSKRTGADTGERDGE